jgi:hypothetical protein
MITPMAEEVLLKSGGGFRAGFSWKRLALWSHLHNLIEGIAKVNGSSTLRCANSPSPIITLFFDKRVRHICSDFLGCRISESNVVVWVPRTNYLPMITIG